MKLIVSCRSKTQITWTVFGQVCRYLLPVPPPQVELWLIPGNSSPAENTSWQSSGESLSAAVRPVNCKFALFHRWSFSSVTSGFVSCCMMFLFHQKVWRTQDKATCCQIIDLLEWNDINEQLMIISCLLLTEN